VAEWAGATFVGLLLYGVIGFTVIRSGLSRDFRETNNVPVAADSTNSEKIGEGFLNVQEATAQAKISGMPHDRAAPQRTRMGYLLPFEIVSVHLLVVLIGAAYLARAKRRRRIAA
jgi:hypothetical protein